MSCKRRNSFTRRMPNPRGNAETAQAVSDSFDLFRRRRRAVKAAGRARPKGARLGLLHAFKVLFTRRGAR